MPEKKTYNESHGRVFNFKSFVIRSTRDHLSVIREMAPTQEIPIFFLLFPFSCNFYPVACRGRRLRAVSRSVSIRKSGEGNRRWWGGGNGDTRWGCWRCQCHRRRLCHRCRHRHQLRRRFYIKDRCIQRWWSIHPVRYMGFGSRQCNDVQHCMWHVLTQMARSTKQHVTRLLKTLFTQ